MISQQIRHSLKNYLSEHTVYDTLAANNQVVAIDAQISCLQFIELFFINNCENIVIWNEMSSEFEAVLCYREMVKIVLRFYYNVMNQKNNFEFYKINTENEKALSSTTSLVDSNSMEGICNVLEIVEEDEKYQIDDKEEQQELEQNASNKTYKVIQQSQKNQLLSDLQTVTIDQFMYNSSVSNVLLVDEKQLLIECCELMAQVNRNQVNVFDSESNLIVGTLSHKDILLHIIQNYQLNENDKLVQFFEEPFDIYQLQMFKQQNEIVQCKTQQSVYQMFKTMNYHKMKAISIVDDNMSYVGLVHLSDIKFVLKQIHFEVFSKNCLQFLDYLKQQKSEYNATKNQLDCIYQKNCSMLDLVKQMLEVHENRLVKLDVDNLVEGIIGLEDLFHFIIQNNQ